MNKTKTKILAAARDLFNEKGFGNVTIRMIALKANMSSGNLNYHFQKKEEILEAIYFEMVQTFDERLHQLEQKELTLKTAKEDITESLKRMVDYRFFWTDLYNLLRQNSSIKNHFEDVYNKRFLGCKFLFKTFQEQDLMQAFSFDKEADFLAERMINNGNTWLYNSFLYEEHINDQRILHQSASYLGIIYPYLTELGQEEYRNLFREVIE